MDSLDRIDLREDIDRALHRGAALIVRHLAASNGGLSLSSCAVLAALADDGGTRLTRLAASSGITQPAMTQLVGRLERDGLVIRLVDPDDGRATVVEITKEGRALLAQLRQARRDSLGELLNELSPEDEVTLGLAMRVAAPLLDELTNVAVNVLPSRGSEPDGVSVGA